MGKRRLALACLLASTLFQLQHSSLNQQPDDVVTILTDVPPEPSPKTKRRLFRAIDERTCLALALFYEASTEPDEGIEAVAAVIFNRVRHRRYPSTICGVIYQPAQFPWAPRVTTLPTSRTFRALLKRASDLIRNQRTLRDRFGSITHFHRFSVRPRWADQLVEAFRIGAHVFYQPALEAHPWSFPSQL